MTYVRPHLEYAITSWNPWTVQDKEQLEKVQIRALKMCTNLKAKTYSEKLKEAGIDSLEERRTKFDLTQVWKILHKFDRVDESVWFEKVQETSERTTRLSSSPWNICLKDCKTDQRKNFFSNRVVKDWNNLPEEIKSCEKIGTFKSKLKALFVGRTP